LKNSAFTNLRAQLYSALTSSTRQLSMVFFVGRGRAHTYRVPLIVVYTFIIALSSVVVWGISSIGLVSYYSQQNQWLEQQLNLTRDIVFKYQTQYENIYERSYPNVSQQESDRALDVATAQIEGENKPKTDELTVNGGKPATIESVPADTMDAEADEDSLPSMDNRLIAEAEARAQAAEIAALESQRKAEVERIRKIAEAEKIKAAAVAKEQEIAKAQAAAQIEVATKTEKSNSPLTSETVAKSGQLGQRDVAVRNLKLLASPSGLDVNFSIQNSSNIPKAQGYMYVVGKFVTTSGRTQYIAAPAGIDVNINSGEARQPTQGESFSVARGRPAKFSLASPVGDAGRFVEVQIVLTDRDGKLADELRQSVKSSDVATKDPTNSAQ